MNINNWEQRPDYQLTGRIERPDEIDYGGSVKVEARLAAELTNLRTGAVVSTGDASQTSKVDQHNVSFVAAEMDDAVQESIQRSGGREQDHNRRNRR